MTAATRRVLITTQGGQATRRQVGGTFIAVRTLRATGGANVRWALRAISQPMDGSGATTHDLGQPAFGEIIDAPPGERFVAVEVVNFADAAVALTVDLSVGWGRVRIPAPATLTPPLALDSVEQQSMLQLPGSPTAWTLIFAPDLVSDALIATRVILSTPFAPAIGDNVYLRLGTAAPAIDDDPSVVLTMGERIEFQAPTMRIYARKPDTVTGVPTANHPDSTATNARINVLVIGASQLSGLLEYEDP